MKRESDWRIFPPQFAEIVNRVGCLGETLYVDCGNKGRALNFATRIRSYCKALRNAPIGDEKNPGVGSLRDFAPMVSARLDPAKQDRVLVQPQAESVNAKLADQMLLNPPVVVTK